MAPVTIVAIGRARFSRKGAARGAENLIQREDIPMKEKLSKQAKSVVLALSLHCLGCSRSGARLGKRLMRLDHRH